MFNSCRFILPSIISCPRQWCLSSLLHNLYRKNSSSVITKNHRANFAGSAHIKIKKLNRRLDNRRTVSQLITAEPVISERGKGISDTSKISTGNFSTRSGAGATELLAAKVKMSSLFPKNLTESTAFEQFFNEIDAVMFDCDGVLWIGMKALPNAPELVKKLRALGKKVFFMTNNSTKTREEFLAKFNTLGFEATMDEIVSTSYLAALYLKEKNFDKKVYVIGTTGVTRELQQQNIQALPIGADVVPAHVVAWGDHLETISLDPEVGAVVVGFDHHFSYPKLFKAASYLKNPSCLFIATNTDESFPSHNNLVIPGTGSIVNSVKTAAQRDPVVMGKPHRFPFEYVQRFHNLQCDRILMVGDRANTDILFGSNCGLHTLLVLTGVTTLQEVTEWVQSGSEEVRKYIPEFYLEDVGGLYKLVEHL